MKKYIPFHFTRYILLILLLAVIHPSELYTTQTADQRAWYSALIAKYTKQAREARDFATQTLGGFVQSVAGDIQKTIQSLIKFITDEHNRINMIQKTITILQNDMSSHGPLVSYFNEKNNQSLFYFKKSDIPLFAKLTLGNQIFIQSIHIIKEEKILLKTLYLMQELAQFITSINFLLRALKPFAQDKQLLEQLQQNITKFFDRITRLTPSMIGKTQLSKIAKEIKKLQLPSIKKEKTLKSFEDINKKSLISTLWSARNIDSKRVRDMIHHFLSEFSIHFHNINIAFDDLEKQLHVLVNLDQESGKQESIIDHMHDSLRKNTLYEGFFSLMNNLNITTSILLTTVTPVTISLSIASNILTSLHYLIQSLDQEVAQKIDRTLSQRLQNILPTLQTIYCALSNFTVMLVGASGLQEMLNAFSERKDTKKIQSKTPFICPSIRWKQPDLIEQKEEEDDQNA